MNSAIVNWSTKPEVSSVSPFLPGHHFDESFRQYQPAEPKPRRQRLAHRAHINDMFGIDALQRADWAAVVSEFPVVIIFDDHSTGSSRPINDRCAAVGMQRHAKRELMRRREQHTAHFCHVLDRHDVSTIGVPPLRRSRPWRHLS
jgi:hypothetical protein